jgi:hypothetical protein
MQHPQRRGSALAGNPSRLPRTAAATTKAGTAYVQAAPTVSLSERALDRRRVGDMSAVNGTQIERNPVGFEPLPRSNPSTTPAAAREVADGV